jgi:hypothetical protein
MKRLFLLIFVIFVIFVMLCSCDKDDHSEKNTKDELTIYDKNGNAVAYCSFLNEEETVIYLWNGKPTAYFSDSDKAIYGFNGIFLGWRESGIYYDLEGKKIGFENGSYNILTSIEPIKFIKEIIPTKSVKEVQPLRPINRESWSDMGLDIFFLRGRQQ